MTQKRSISFAEFAKANLDRCQHKKGFNHKLNSWSTSDWIVATLGELGEAANIAKKLNRCRDGVPGNTETEEALRAKLAKELGDVFVYLDLLCQSIGTTVEQATLDVFNAKSKQIGYPVILE